MLTDFVDFLNALGNVDDGVECVLNDRAHQSILFMVQNIYGHNIADMVDKAFHRNHEDDTWKCVIENLGDQVRSALQERSH
jgi:hypothetical protein